MSDEDATMAAIDAINDLTVKIGLPRKLSEVGVEESGLEAIAELSLSDGAIVYNPKLIFEADQVMEVLRKAY